MEKKQKKKRRRAGGQEGAGDGKEEEERSPWSAARTSETGRAEEAGRRWPSQCGCGGRGAALNSEEGPSSAGDRETEQQSQGHRAAGLMFQSMKAKLTVIVIHYF